MKKIQIKRIFSLSFQTKSVKLDTNYRELREKMIKNWGHIALKSGGNCFWTCNYTFTTVFCPLEGQAFEFESSGSPFCAWTIKNWHAWEWENEPKMRLKDQHRGSNEGKWSETMLNNFWQVLESYMMFKTPSNILSAPFLVVKCLKLSINYRGIRGKMNKQRAHIASKSGETLPECASARLIKFSVL